MDGVSALRLRSGVGGLVALSCTWMAVKKGQGYLVPQGP